MKSEGEKQKETSDRTAGFEEDSPIRPLHDCACYFISLAHSWLERITHFPFPIGTVIGCAEDLVDRWAHPLTQALQSHGLSILASIDDQIFSLVEGCGLCSKVQLKVALSELYTQGFIGTSACLWIKYEPAVKEDIRKAVSLADRVPLLNLVIPIFLSLITPSARAMSNWLLKQGEKRVDESSRTVDSSFAFILKQEVASESKGTAVTKSVQLAGSMQLGPMIMGDVGGVQTEGQNVSDVLHAKEEGSSEERCVIVDNVVKDDVLHAKEDTNVDNVVKDEVPHAKNVYEMLFEQTDVSAEGIVEVDVFSAERDVSVDDMNVGKAVPASKKKGVSHAAEEGDDYLPDVLELLESSWLLGTAAFTKNAPTLSQKKRTSSSGFTFFNG